MIVEQSLTKYVAEKTQNNMSSSQSIVIIVENSIQMKIWNALFREHQRFRQQILQLNIIEFNNHRTYQQFVIQFNKFRNDLIWANQDLAILQRDFDQKKIIIDFEKQQLNMTNNALQQKIKSRIRTKKCLRMKNVKVQMLFVIVIRFNIITTKNLEFILSDEIDVNIIFNDFVIHFNDIFDSKVLIQQITFTFLCYKDLINHLKEQNEHLIQMIEKKNVEMKIFKIDFDQNYNEDENIFE